MPVQTVTYPFSPSSSPYTPVYGERDRFREAGKPLRNLPSNPSTRGTDSQTHTGSGDGDISSSLESSPETTPSLMNVPSLSDTPGPSPDTPAPLESLSHRSFAPPKKARNLKNLAVNTTSSMPYGRAFSTAALPVQTRQETAILPGPATASFIKPAALPRRPSSKLGLTIMTPTLDTHPIPNDNFSTPPTPSLIRPVTLRRFQSSPLLPLNLPRSAGLPPTPMTLTSMGFSDVPFESDEQEQSQRFDLPQSREEKPEAYPDGPICIYEPHVDLYFEPTIDEAAAYDVILNVASEVVNPFSPPDGKVSSSYAKENQARVRPTDAKPEYIHIPWEHNTDIVPDLLRLVQLIDNRVQQGKRVLIHCQCGVSRSASLIVAYGIYRNPTMTVQQAYDAVKRRSKWIGPNMSLIMQLQEFRTKLLQAKGITGSGQRARSKTTQGGSLLASGSVPQSAPHQSRAVPSAITVVPGRSISPGPSSAPSNMSSSIVKPTSTTEPFSNVGTPVVTPSGQMVQMITKTIENEQMKKSKFPEPISTPTLAAPEILSPRSSEFAMASIHPPSLDDTFGLTSPRFGGFPSEIVDQPLSQHSTKAIGVKPSSPPAMTQSGQTSLDALLSPRAAEFTITPFNQATAAPLASSPVKAHKQTGVLPLVEEDPRSPVQKGASPIVRHIFDVMEQ